MEEEVNKQRSRVLLIICEFRVLRGDNERVRVRARVRIARKNQGEGTTRKEKGIVNITIRIFERMFSLSTTTGTIQNDERRDGENTALPVCCCVG